nr:hypothetical protein [uncultured Sellimonas sp.]
MEIGGPEIYRGRNCAVAEGAFLMPIQTNDPRTILVVSGYPMFVNGKSTVESASVTEPKSRTWRWQSMCLKS